MNELTYRKIVAAAIREPDVPGTLVERTKVRSRGIVDGRAAQQRLAALKEAPPGEELQRLAAQCIVGQLMLETLPPEGVSCQMMIDQLMQQAAFQQCVTQPAETLLRSVQSGELLERLASSEEPERSACGRSPSVPENTVRNKGGPGL